jgi:hypothetical protein|tara:strand:+ start:208 stop:471 length:264 start_codon:yes stop_codon:yes gene_type:complete
MSKQKSMYEDMEQRYWEIADRELVECESEYDFIHTMDKHKHLLTFIPQDEDPEVYIESMLSDMWSEKWAKYQEQAMVEAEEYEHNDY